MSSFSPVVYTLLGLLTGGLINILADRLPRREPLGPPSCPACDRPRPWYGWLATAHHLLARGRCPHCGARTSLRYPLTEIIAAALFAFLWRRYGPSPRLFFETLYTAILMLLFVIDLEHRLILHVTTLPAILLALAGSFFLSREGYNWRLALLGGATGFVLVWGMYLFGHLFVRLLERRRSVEITEVAFGFGDVTLTTFIGVVVGFPGVVFALVLGVVLGGIGGAIYWLIQALLRRRYTAFTTIPYGPFLVVAGWSLMIWGHDFFQWYAGS